MSFGVKDKTREDTVREFHEAFGHPINSANEAQIKLRAALIVEEANEVFEALHELAQAVHQDTVAPIDVEEVLKELCDLQYVLSGTVVALKEIPDSSFTAAYNRVHSSNLSKLDENGQPIYNDDGKVMKGPNYTPPDLSDLV